MKKNILLISLFLICSSLTISAQSQKVPRQDFFAPSHRAYEILRKSSRREKNTSKLYSNDILKWTEIKINEFILPDKKRLLIIREEGKKKENEEFIEIEKIIYHRKNGSNWVKVKI